MLPHRHQHHTLNRHDTSKAAQILCSHTKLFEKGAVVYPDLEYLYVTMVCEERESQAEHSCADVSSSTPATGAADRARASQTPPGPGATVATHVATLADPAVRRAVVTARDLPSGLGDIDASLLLLFKSIRRHSTVALSGESADEIFGGYWGVGRQSSQLRLQRRIPDECNRCRGP
jgi:hypothetical protein